MKLCARQIVILAIGHSKKSNSQLNQNDCNYYRIVKILTTYHQRCKHLVFTVSMKANTKIQRSHNCFPLRMLVIWVARQSEYLMWVSRTLRKWERRLKRILNVSIVQRDWLFRVFAMHLVPYIINFYPISYPQLFICISFSSSCILPFFLVS